MLKLCAVFLFYILFSSPTCHRLRNKRKKLLVRALILQVRSVNTRASTFRKLTSFGKWRYRTPLLSMRKSRGSVHKSRLFRAGSTVFFQRDVKTRVDLGMLSSSPSLFFSWVLSSFRCCCYRYELSSGVVLIELLFVLEKKTLSRYHKKPSSLYKFSFFVWDHSFYLIFTQISQNWKPWFRIEISPESWREADQPQCTRSVT